MFGKAELEVLRLRRELLVLKSETDRLLLAAELQRVRSADYWLVETGRAMRRHPVLTAILGGGVGLLAVQALRRPAATSGWLGRLGALSSTALSVWRLFAERKRDE
jgi:hypothetical protein